MNTEGKAGRALLWTSFLLVALLSSLVTSVYFLRMYQQPAFSAVSEMAKTIEENYYFADENTSDEQLSDAALRGMIDSIGDDYAAYYTVEEYDELRAEDTGEYVGIGVSVQQPDDVGSLILAVYEGGPMQEAGVLAGDVIVEINGTVAAGLSMDDFLNCFSTDDKKADELLIRRGEETFTVTAKRRIIHVLRVHFELLSDGRTGYIRMDEFAGNVAGEFSDAIKALTDQGAERLVIDLRNNPGGGLTEVLDCTDQVLQKGQKIASVRNRDGDEVVYTAENDGVELPIAVLVNGYSASGSEMFTGALKDNDRAVVVGETTFGKGIVQSYYKLTGNNGWVKMTTDAYYTPSGICIHGEGIAPDIAVEMPDEDGDGYVNISALDHAEDPQLNAALQYLNKDQL